MATRGDAHGGPIGFSSSDMIDDRRKQTGLFPPLGEEERIARSLRKYRRRMAYYERRRRGHESFKRRFKRGLITFAAIAIGAIIAAIVKSIP